MQTSTTMEEPVPATQQDEEVFAQQLKETTMKTKKTTSNLFVIGVVVAIVLGISTGYVLASSGNSSTPSTTTATSKTGSTTTAALPTIQVGQVFGSKDVASFKDSAEGVLLPGGIGSEGSQHIVRAGGASQNVYLTSSVVDLSTFENAKVKVYGQTYQAQKAGWLMDVGRVEVEELNAPLPDWAVKTQQAAQNAQGNE